MSMLRKTSTVAALLVASLTRTDAFVPPSTSTRLSLSWRLSGIQPDAFGEWMLEDRSDYDRNPQPKMKQPFRVPLNEAPVQPPRRPPSEQDHFIHDAYGYGNRRRYGAASPEYYLAEKPKPRYHSEEYKKEQEFIQRAQGTNRMDENRWGLPHQQQEVLPPAQTQQRRHYSLEHKQQDDFINRAQGTNRMDENVWGLPHQQQEVKPPAQTQQRRRYSAEYAQEDDFINRAQGTNRMDENVWGLPHQQQEVKPPAQTQQRRRYSPEYAQEDDFINRAQGTNRMDENVNGIPHQMQL